MLKALLLTAFVLILAENAVLAASVEKAAMLRQHGLLSQAKAELVDVIFSNSTEVAKAQAYYELGNIAFEEKNINAAVDTWTQLIQKFAKSPEAALVKDRLKELAEIVGEVSRETVENAVAQSYLRHAEFWSKGKDQVFQIDSSWIPHVEAAVKWYDKVIAEYPKSVASRLAYEGKLRTLLGWKDLGQYGQAHGVEADFKLYMPQVLSSFGALEAEHPEASSLQAFRYQIAQAYWSQRDWAKTREWLTLVIQKSGDKDGFYRDLAERRLRKVEY